MKQKNTLLIVNTPENERIAHFMRMNWVAVRNYQGPGAIIMSRKFSTKQACANTVKKLNVRAKTEFDVWHPAPDVRGKQWFILQYDNSYDALVPVIKQIMKMQPQHITIKLLQFQRQIQKCPITEGIKTLHAMAYAFADGYLEYKDDQHKERMAKLKK